MEEITKKPTNEIVKEISYLEQEINLMTITYNHLLNELIRRYPTLSELDDFKEKELINEKRKKYEQKT